MVVNLSPYLRGPAEFPPEWRWALAPSWDLAPARLLAPATVAAAIMLWLRWRLPPARAGLGHLLILAALASALMVAVLFTSTSGIPLMARLISPEYAGYFQTAVKYRGLKDFLSSYTEKTMTLGGRIRTHPPGNLVFFWLIYRLAQSLPQSVVVVAGQFLRAHSVAEWAAPYTNVQLVAAAMAGLAVVAIAALTVVPLYYLARDAGGDARQALALFLVCPAITLFAPVVDLTYTLPAATALWLAYTGFQRRSYARLVLSGAVLSILVFMSFSTLPLLFTVGVLGVVLAGQTPAAERLAALGRLLTQCLGIAAGSAFAWIVFWANPIAIFLPALARQSEDRVSRNYWTWLLYNPYDVLLFAGLPLAVFFRRLWLRQTLAPGECLSLSVALGMAGLFASGIMRGEAARTLLYYYPIMALVGALGGQERPPRQLAVVAAATLVQTTLFYLGLRVYH